MTKLPNRLLLKDRFNQAANEAKRNKKINAILVIDLDNFKLINDLHGHPGGDFYLIELAKRLMGCTRSSDTVARLGGDEFVVIAKVTKKRKKPLYWPIKY